MRWTIARGLGLAEWSAVYAVHARARRVTSSWSPDLLIAAEAVAVLGSGLR